MLICMAASFAQRWIASIHAIFLMLCSFKRKAQFLTKFATRLWFIWPAAIDP